MNRDQKKFLIIALVVSFMAAGDRLLRFYYESVPPISEGECVKVDLPRTQEEFVGRVVENNIQHKIAVIETNSDGFTHQKMVTFVELRELGAERISCETLR